MNGVFRNKSPCEIPEISPAHIPGRNDTHIQPHRKEHINEQTNREPIRNKNSEEMYYLAMSKMPQPNDPYPLPPHNVVSKQKY